MVSATQVGVLSAALCVVFLIATIIFGLGFSIVQPNYVGIVQSTLTKTIDDKQIFPPGRYYIGVGNDFITFPTTWQLVDFSADKEGFGGPSLSVFSKEGQTIVIDVSFYFKINENMVVNLYRLAGVNYPPLIERKSQEVMKNVASNFTTTEFFTRREDITSQMRDALNSALYDLVYCVVPTFQLRAVNLPADLEKALVDKIVANQNQRTELLKREITIIQAKTTVIQANAQANVTIEIQQATSAAFQLTETARAEARKTVLDAQNNVLLTLRNGLNFTNPQLFNYMYSQSIATTPASTKLLVGLKGATIITN